MMTNTVMRGSFCGRRPALFVIICGGRPTWRPYMRTAACVIHYNLWRAPHVAPYMRTAGRPLGVPYKGVPYKGVPYD